MSLINKMLQDLDARGGAGAMRVVRRGVCFDRICAVLSADFSASIKKNTILVQR